MFTIQTLCQVHLNQWNHLSVYRHDWGVWLQLNGGKQEEGRSKVMMMMMYIYYDEVSVCVFVCHKKSSLPPGSLL